MSRRAGLGPVGLMVVTGINLGFGIVIVLLKYLLH